MANPNWKKGISGNPKGRAKGSVNEAKAQLFAALKAAEKKNGISFISDYVQKSYNDTPRAIALLKKIVPDLTEADIGDETLRTFADIIKKGVNAGG
jgi:3-phosphoglycerate kinase